MRLRTPPACPTFRPSRPSKKGSRTEEPPGPHRAVFRIGHAAPAPSSFRARTRNPRWRTAVGPGCSGSCDFAQDDDLSHIVIPRLAGMTEGQKKTPSGVCERGYYLPVERYCNARSSCTSLPARMSAGSALRTSSGVMPVLSMVRPFGVFQRKVVSRSCAPSGNSNTL